MTSTLSLAGSAIATSFASGALSVDTANLLLQAVVDTGAKTRDGDIIIGLAPAWSKIISILQKDPRAAFQISPRKWEEIIAGAYEEAGFDKVILTPHSGDLGRDVIAEKHGYWSIRIIDQVKAYGPKHLVPANDVRALVGVVQMDHTATKGIVTTTSNFAPKIADDPTIAPLLAVTHLKCKWSVRFRCRKKHRWELPRDVRKQSPLGTESQRWQLILRPSNVIA